MIFVFIFIYTIISQGSLLQIKQAVGDLKKLLSQAAYETVSTGEELSPLRNILRPKEGMLGIPNEKNPAESSSHPWKALHQGRKSVRVGLSQLFFHRKGYEDQWVRAA